MNPRDLLGDPSVSPRFVIFSSYGNDSVALIQWAKEQSLRDVFVVYSDTKWSASWWQDRVETMEWWVESLGFHAFRTTSIGFRELAFQKKAFPTQQYQWCSYILKIEPGQRWLREYDPDCRAICLVGVRREEGVDRANFPRYLPNSVNHGGRVMLAPFADYSADERDSLLMRAGVEPLPHRSMECAPCINSNRADIKALSDEEITAVEHLEQEMHEKFGPTKKGKRRTFFRPHRHMGAVGIREVKKWADAGRGKYKPDLTIDDSLDDDPPRELDLYTCQNGFCVS